MVKRKIALIGIPGSGKTVTAEAVERAIVMDDGSCEECDTPIGIIDHYAETVAVGHDYAIGLEGGWLASISIAMERYGLERHMASQNKTLITCGTLLESSVYMTMHFEEMSRGMEEHELADAYTRMEAGMRFFAALYVDTFHYNRVFYLPPLGGDYNERTKTLDKNFQAAFQAFNLTPVEPLMFEGDSVEEVISKRVTAILTPPKEGDETNTEWTGHTAS